MPTLAFNLFDAFRKDRIQGGGYDITATNITMAIITATATPNQVDNDFWDDLSAAEVVGGGYTANGNALANVTVTLSTGATASGTVTVDMDDPTAWAQTTSGFTNGQRFVVLRNTGSASTSNLIGYSALASSAFGNVSGPVSVTLSANGLFESTR